MLTPSMYDEDREAGVYMGFLSDYNCSDCNVESLIVPPGLIVKLYAGLGF